MVLLHDRSDCHTIAPNSAVIKHFHPGLVPHRARPAGARNQRGVLRMSGRSQPVLANPDTARLRVPPELSSGRLLDRAGLCERALLETDLLSHGKLLAEKRFPCQVPVRRRQLLPLRETHPIVQLKPAESKRFVQAGENEHFRRSNRRAKANLVSGQPHPEEPVLFRRGADAVLRAELPDRGENQKTVPAEAIYRDGGLERTSQRHTGLNKTLSPHSSS